MCVFVNIYIYGGTFIYFKLNFSIVLNYSESACACMCVHKSVNASAGRGIGYLWTEVTNDGATWLGCWEPNSDNHESGASTFNLWTIIRT